MTREILLFTEHVTDGEYASWPDSPYYEEPVYKGHKLIGWDFDWETTPISGDTEIRTIWEPVEIHIESNKYTIGCEGDEDLSNLTEITYWAETANGNINLTEEANLDLQVVPLEDGLDEIEFTEGATSIVDGKKVMSIIIDKNMDNYPRYLRLKAVTDKYGGMESESIEITQEAREFVFEFSTDNRMTVDTSYHENILTPSLISTKNGEYYGDLDVNVRNGSEWITFVEIVQFSPTEFKLKINVNQFPTSPIYDPTIGREGYIDIQQNESGLQKTIMVQQVMDSEMISVTFLLLNDRREHPIEVELDVTLKTNNNRTINVASNGPILPLDSEIIIKSISYEFAGDKIVTGQPLLGKVNGVDETINFYVEGISNKTIGEFDEDDIVTIRYSIPE